MESITDLSNPEDLLEAGKRARRLDYRHDLAHNFFSASLELARFQHNPAATAKALLWLSNNLLWFCPREIEESGLSFDAMAEEAAQLFRGVGDEAGEASCLRALGKIAESLAIYRRINDKVGVIRTLEQLAASAAWATDRQANELCNEAIQLAREVGDREILADALHSAGVCWQGDDRVRRAAFLEAAELYRDLEYRPDYADSLHICALLACEDDSTLKQELLERAYAVWHELRRFTRAAICLDTMADVAEEVGEIAKAIELRERSKVVGLLPEPY